MRATRAPPSCRTTPCKCRSRRSTSRRSEEHTSELQSPVHLDPLSLHDALPIFRSHRVVPRPSCRAHLSELVRVSEEAVPVRSEKPRDGAAGRLLGCGQRGRRRRAVQRRASADLAVQLRVDRKSTRLNSSHPSISTLFPYTTLFRSFDPTESFLVPHAARTFLNSFEFQKKLFRFDPKNPVTVLLADFSDAGNAGAAVVPYNAVQVQISPFNFA